jgi:hypothetical protein
MPSSNPNTKTARQLLTELQPGKYLTMYDPKNTSFIMTQCARIGSTYYLAGPQFSVFTAHRLPLPACLRTEGVWELESLFEAARAEGDTEAALVKLANDFLAAHGARPDDLLFTCVSLDDTINTLAGLYATFKR